MPHNALRAVFRFFRRNPVYSLVNVGGLAVGLACFFLIVLYLKFETGFDRFHADASRIYRVVLEDKVNTFQRSNLFAVTNAPLAPTLLAEVAGLEDATRFDGNDSMFLEVDGDGVYRAGIYADARFFRVFSFPLRAGQAETVLAHPFSAVISASLAERWFGERNPIGETILIDDYEARITGVHEDVPGNSHLRFDIAVSFETLASIPGRGRNLTTWHNYSYATYVKLGPGIDPKIFEETLQGVIRRFAGEEDADNMRHFLQPLATIHLDPRFNFGTGVVGDPRTIALFTAVAFFILLIACINYVNLATARSALRSREIGIRKVVGARRSQLFLQFSGESFLTVLFALVPALILMVAVFPAYRRFLGRDLTLNPLSDPSLCLFLLGAVVLVGTISGFYPALVLSSFRPVQSLKGGLERVSPKSAGRHLLVVLQFTIAIALISATAAVDRQLRYIRSKDVGFDRARVAVLRVRDEGIRRSAGAFKTELLHVPGISGVSCGSTPLNINGGGTGVVHREDGEEARFTCWKCYVDPDFLEVFQVRLNQGRFFSPDFPTDRGEAVILNRSAVQAAGWRDPIGKLFSLHELDKARVIGVVEDYHFWSLRQKIEPMALIFNPERIFYVSMRLRPGGLGATVEAVEKVYNRFKAARPFHLTFLDDDFNRIYRAERRFASMFTMFSLLSILIACLGLLGLAAFTAERKTREIGIRKVLGASATGIILLLCRRYAFWVAASAAVAWPISHLGMNLWMKNFHYRAEFAWWLFPLSMLPVLLAALGAVGFQTARAARADPADTLRYE